MTVKLGNINFDNVLYDADADVLYLHIGDPASAIDFDDSPEGHGLRFGPGGELVGITILNARWLLEQKGKIEVTLPPQHLEAGADTFAA